MLQLHEVPSRETRLIATLDKRPCIWPKGTHLGPQRSKFLNWFVFQLP